MNRLNMLKRQLFGRAKLARLQPRFLLAAYGQYSALGATASLGSPMRPALARLLGR
jgi:hypothetical protein